MSGSDDLKKMFRRNELLGIWANGSAPRTNGLLHELDAPKPWERRHDGIGTSAQPALEPQERPTVANMPLGEGRAIRSMRQSGLYAATSAPPHRASQFKLNPPITRSGSSSGVRRGGRSLEGVLQSRN
jgi:hypothetical protein